MRIDKVHEKLRLILDMAQAGYFSPEERDIALDVASLQRFAKFLPSYGVDMVSASVLSPFKVVGDFLTTEDGLFSLENCEKFLSASLYVMVGDEKKIRSAKIVNDDELADRLGSQLRKVDKMYPVVHDLGSTLEGDKFSHVWNFKVYPSGESGGQAVWLKRPSQPVMVYSVVDGEEVYNPVGSVDMEWRDKDMVEVIIAAVGILGVALDNAMLVQAKAAIGGS